MSAADEERAQTLRRIEAALDDPAVRARISAALCDAPPAGAPQAAARSAGDVADTANAGGRGSWTSRHKQFFAGLASASVVLLAFLLPSLQDQWDRRQAQLAIDRYASIGRKLLNDGQYDSAEKAFGKALEMSDGHRIDLLEDQLRARVQRVNEDPEWLGRVPEELSESDFVYLLELQGGQGREKQRAATLAAFGAFLASESRVADAEQRLHEALALDPSNVAALVNLGSLMWDDGRLAEAEKSYRTAAAAEPREANARYDLALLLKDSGRCAEAEPVLREYVVLAPREREGWSMLADCLDALGRGADAQTARARSARVTSAPAPQTPSASVQKRAKPRTPRPAP